jgi:hypothetical protein
MRKSILSLAIKDRLIYLFLFILLCPLGSTYGADGNEDALPVIGIVMSLDCPNCKSVFEKRKFIHQVCRVGSYDKLCDVRYLPFIGEENDYRADLYYEIFKIDVEASEKYMEAIYTLNIDRTIELEELAFLVSGYLGNNLDMDEIIGSVKSGDRLEVKKVGRIINRYSIVDYPTFMMFEEREVRVINPTIDPSERLEVALRWIENELE